MNNKILLIGGAGYIGTVTDKSKDPRNYKVSFSKIYKILNFKIKYSVDDGIDEMINFFKKNEKTLNMFNHLKFGNNVIDAGKL